jgi:hypothetical protein
VPRDEAQAVLSILRRIKPHAPEAQALTYDMALRGVHLQEIYRNFGLVPVVPVHAAANPDRGSGRRAGTYKPKVADLETRTVTLPNGEDRTVHLAVHNGWLSIKELTETGDPHYRPLPIVRNQRHEDKDSFRFYQHCRLPPEYGGGVIVLRLHNNAEDDRRGLNRAEVLRPVPEGSADFERLRVLRPDAESINRAIGDTLFLRRASAKGWRRMMVDLLGWARLVNATTLARCRARERIEPAA